MNLEPDRRNDTMKIYASLTVQSNKSNRINKYTKSAILRCQNILRAKTLFCKFCVLKFIVKGDKSTTCDYINSLSCKPLKTALQAYALSE